VTAVVEGRLTPAERLTAGIIIDPETGCHVWTRSRNNRGYGTMHYLGRTELTHRVAWLLRYGELPPKPYVLDHVACENKACCNADHLEPITNRDNVLRDDASPMNVYARSDHCRNGHPWPPEPARRPNGTRRCRECRKAARS
jgi:hypothetical protein